MKMTNSTVSIKKDGYVRARVSTELKVNAERILNDVGLNITDAIRLMLTQVVNRGSFPLELMPPNRTTIDTMNSAAVSKAYNSAQELFADLDNELEN